MDQAADSISEWLGQLKVGEAEAAQKLWDRYSGELIRIARKRLSVSQRRVADEEDVAQSVFGSMFRAAKEGRFAEIATRDDLWWLLLSITKRKSIDHIRREKAQKRHGKPGQPNLQHSAGLQPSGLFSLEDLVSASPTPELLIALEEQYARLLGLLRDDRLREVAVLRIEGYTIAEIAEKMGIGLRAIERKLQLIRVKWRTELTKPDPGP